MQSSISVQNVREKMFHIRILGNCTIAYQCSYIRVHTVLRCKFKAFSRVNISKIHFTDILFVLSPSLLEYTATHALISKKNASSLNTEATSV